MSDSNRNRHSIKGNENEDRTGNEKGQSSYKKLPDDQSNRSDESVSTHGDMSDPKYSRTGKRKEDIDPDTQPGKGDRTRKDDQ